MVVKASRFAEIYHKRIMFLTHYITIFNLLKQADRHTKNQTKLMQTEFIGQKKNCIVGLQTMCRAVKLAVGLQKNCRAMEIVSG